MSGLQLGVRSSCCRGQLERPPHKKTDSRVPSSSFIGAGWNWFIREAVHSQWRPSHHNRKPRGVANSKRVVKILIGLLERGRQKVRLPGLVTSSKICTFSQGFRESSTLVGQTSAISIAALAKQRDEKGVLDIPSGWSVPRRYEDCLIFQRVV